LFRAVKDARRAQTASMAGLDSRVAVANIEMELVAMNPPPTQQVKIYFSNPIYVLCNFSELYVATSLNCMLQIL
jgi:hypothetical protein